MRQLLCRAAISLLVMICISETLFAEDGKALLQRNCGRCHGISEGSPSPNSGAPNLWSRLRSYPDERLQAELSEGIGSKHAGMPQIQFSSEDIQDIQSYLSLIE